MGSCTLYTNSPLSFYIDIVRKVILLDKALALPPNERVVFAELILASIELEEDRLPPQTPQKSASALLRNHP